MDNTYYTLVSKPINHFPIVLYDDDFHCMEEIKYHITEHTDIKYLRTSSVDFVDFDVDRIDFHTYEGFIVLSTPKPIKISPITIILTVKYEKNPADFNIGTWLHW